jgi:hypothetical protein
MVLQEWVGLLRSAAVIFTATNFDAIAQGEGGGGGGPSSHGRTA